MPIGLGTAVLGAGALGAGAQLIGSSQQAGAAKDANATQLAMFNQTQKNLQPFIGQGQAAGGVYNQLLGLGGGGGGAAGGSGQSDADIIKNLKQGLTDWNTQLPGNAGGILNLINSGAPLSSISSALNSLRQTTTNPANTAFLDPLIAMAGSGGQGATGAPAMSTADRMNWLAQTPGYQFNLNQGLESTQNSFAARGLGSSGAALRGAADYSQGLASNVFNNYLQQLYQEQQLGANAAAGLGTTSAGVANSIGAGTIAAGTAGASGLIGAGNSIGNSLINYQLLSQQQPQFGSGGNNGGGGGGVGGGGYIG